MRTRDHGILLVVATASLLALAWGHAHGRSDNARGETLDEAVIVSSLGMSAGRADGSTLQAAVSPTSTRRATNGRGEVLEVTVLAPPGMSSASRDVVSWVLR